MSASSNSGAVPVHVIFGTHDLYGGDQKSAVEAIEAEGQGVNKPVERKHRIQEALKACAKASPGKITFQPIEKPAPSLKPAELVHSPQLVALFATGFARWEALGDAGRDLYFSTAGRVDPPDWSELVPSQIAPRDPYQRPGNNVHSEVNYYSQDRMTPITAHTSTLLHHDLAVTLEAVAALEKGLHTNVYAGTTQPGHHSGPESFGGYCYVNQAALATTLLKSKFGKVALLDVDYHAGNGSMTIFYKDPDVFFTSLHADPDIEYPYCCGFADQCGEGAGAGSTLNIPLPKGTDWAAYKVQLARALDAIRSFGAKALVVSLGVDTLGADPECAPLAGFKLSAAAGDYREMGSMVRALGLPTITVQEGGYLLSEVAQAVTQFLGADAGEQAKQ